MYYSTLIHLLECERCGLVWADAHIDQQVVRRHFEATYKDDLYFRESRSAIFEHLATLIEALAPEGSRILDIGGARGDLMAKVVARRSDLHVTIHDLSQTATAWAAEHFGFATLTGDANVLMAHAQQYDLVVLSDVLYYEPNLRALWTALTQLVRRDGAIVARVPNRALLMRLGQTWVNLTSTKAGRALQDRVPFYNPEHIFVLRRRYLRDRLKRLGFRRVAFCPSPLLTRANWSTAQSAFFSLASLANRLSRGALVVTPSAVAIGTQYDPRGACLWKSQ